MKKILIIIAACCFFGSAANAAMSISSPDFKEGAMIPLNNVFNGMGCTGNNIFPRMEIDNIPKETKSLAITVYDPDAPTGSGWWHFVVYNIPSSVRSMISGNAKIANIQDFGLGTLFGKNDFGTFGYGGPCPPVGSGNHHYILTAYALKVDNLVVPRDASGAMIGYNINANLIEKASVTAIYQR